jgi:predicted transcriptional regulator
LIEAKKQEYYGEKEVELPMSLSTKKVLQLFKQERVLRMEEISSRLPNYTNRTLRHALRELKEMDLLYSRPDIRDMRRKLYVYKKPQ